MVMKIKMHKDIELPRFQKGTIVYGNIDHLPYRIARVLHDHYLVISNDRQQHTMKLLQAVVHQQYKLSLSETLKKL